MTVKLSKNSSSLTWEKLRCHLKDNLDNDKFWDKAIGIIKQRVNERYFDPIKALLSIRNKKGEGFSIVTIQCALIEFLSACRYGMIYKYDYNQKTDPNYYYKASSDIFSKLLDNAEIFEDYFHNKKKTQAIFLSKDFYTNVRCALLHEAYTRNGWTINTTSELKDDLTNTIIFKKYQGKKKIFRTALHSALENYFNSYILELSESSIKGQTLRKYLARKLDQICEVIPDANYWWL